VKRLGGAGVAASLFLLLVVLVYADPLFTHKNFAGRALLLYHLPIDLPLRHPEKFAVLIAFSVAVFAGLAWDELRKRPRPSRWIVASARSVPTR
jgi:hypothetical protein